MTGSLRGSVRSTTGREASSGRASRRLSSFSRTPSAAKSMSVPHAKRTVTSELPSRLVLSTFCTPGTVLTACSTGSVMKRSTSAGATPALLVYTTSRG